MNGGLTRPKPTLVLAAFFAAAVLLIAGCSAGTEGGGRFLSKEEVLAEYAAAASELEMPPGFAFPEMYIDPEAGSFEEGVGLVAAQMEWSDAWMVEWLEQRGKDPEREARALEVLRDEVPTKEFMTQHTTDATRRSWAEHVRKAEMGDPSGFQNLIDVNQIKPKRTQ